MAKKTVILLVEDDNLLIRMYQEKFTRDGYKINIALNGEEGFRKLEEERPALILLDVMMPKMDGFEVLKRIKADQSMKNIPVILLTNLGGEDDARKGLEMGAVAYLVKSEYTPGEVVAKVKEILAGYAHGKVPEVAKVKKKSK